MKKININKSIPVCGGVGLAGIGMIIGGYFLEEMAKDALILAGTSLLVIAMPALALLIIKKGEKAYATKPKPKPKIEPQNFLLNLGVSSIIAAVIGIGIGYGGVHLGIGSLLQKSGLSFAAVIGIESAIIGVIGFISGCAWSVKYGKECIPHAITLGVSAIAATILPEIIANAMGMHGDAGLAFEVLIGTAAMATVIALFESFISLYENKKSLEIA